MEENVPSEQENKPFSVLERFRQLKEKNFASGTPDLPESKLPTTSGTVFQTSKESPKITSDKADNATTDKSKYHGKRNLNNYLGNSEKKQPGDLHRGLQEADVGITEFIRDGPGFEVIMKQRYTDFQVNEIDLRGSCVRLTSTDLLKLEDEPDGRTEEEDPTILTPEQWATLKEITEKELSSTVNVDVTSFEKVQRQKLHKAVKRRFGARVYSNTRDVDGKKIVHIGYASAQNDYRFCTWPKGRPEYLHFVIFKENVDMTEALNILGRYTHYKVNKFSYAGTKDKRAVTTQQMCIRRGNSERFKNCQLIRGIAVGNYAYKWENLRLGDLKGNRFKIVLRRIKASDALINESVENLKKNGFINYFGLQRFGQSVLIPTYSIGKAILRCDWKLAVELILIPRKGEATFKDLKEARTIWWETRCASQALKPLTRKDRTVEGKILMALKKHGPNAYKNAIDNLPRCTVSMYLHSYQSLIWNKVISRRIQEFGLKVLPGDLVKIDNRDDNISESVGKGYSDDDDDDYDYEEKKDVNETENAKIEVKVLTEIEAKKTSIWDVVYPLPGYNIRLPGNKVGTWYIEHLQKDNFTLESFSLVEKKYGMQGSYRTILERPEDMSWRTVAYSDPDQDLLLSDLEVLKGKSPPNLDKGGSLKALIIEFNLKVCCYATMALRELTKCETSTSSQAMLTNQAKEEDLARKRQKLDDDKNVNQEMEADAIGENNTNTTPGENNTQSDMETESNSAKKEDDVDDGDIDNDEVNEMKKREAEAENFINKYLERTFH